MGKNIKKRAADGQVSLGLYVATTDPAIVEMAAYAGFDFIRIDCEHMLFDKSVVADMIRTANNIDLPVFVRVSSLDDITGLLDFGASGLIVPGVSSKEDALRAVGLTKYAPLGERGMSTCGRCLKYGHIAQKDYLSEANEQVSLIVQLETKEALANIDDILSVAGIDMVATGKSDLAQSLGVIGQPNHPQVVEAENIVVTKALEYGKIPTLMGDTPEKVAELIKRGVLCVTVGYDTKLILKALKDYMGKFSGLATRTN